MQYNVIFAFFGGLIATWFLSVAKQSGYVPTSDIIFTLPGAISLALAHGWTWVVAKYFTK
jgi:hypothetical protein